MTENFVKDPILFLFLLVLYIIEVTAGLESPRGQFRISPDEYCGDHFWARIISNQINVRNVVNALQNMKAIHNIFQWFEKCSQTVENAQKIIINPLNLCCHCTEMY